MADNLTPFDPNGPATLPVKDAPAGSPVSAFVNSRSGKILVGALLVLVVLGIGGYFAFSFFMSKSGQPAPSTSTTSTSPSGGTTSSTTTKSVPAVEAPEVPLSDVFTFRDIFVVTIEATTSATTSSTSSTTTSSTTETNVLTLVSITEDNGVKVANLTWNGATYSLEAGESIPNSPWKVVSIGTDSVVMLYGDTTVTLTVGSGIAK